MKKFKEFISEEGEGGIIGSSAPTNSVGSGNLAGCGVGPRGEPPGPKGLLFKKIKKITRKGYNG